MDPSASSPSHAVVEDKFTTFDLISFSYQIPIFFTRWLINFWSKRLSGRPIAHLHRRQLLAITYMQALRNTLRPRQLAALSRHPPTGPRVEAFCAKNDFKLETVSVSAGGEFPDALLHFITLKEGKGKGNVTMLYSHGGGYHNPLIGNGHIPFALDCAAACGATSLVILEYSFTPEYPYPCQLVQGIAALRYILEKKHIPAGDVVLAGDSAGAHLTAGVLAHIVEPSPFAPPLSLGEKQSLRAAVLVSPWVSMTGEEASIQANAQDDYLTESRLIEFRDWLSSDMTDVWVNPWEAPNAPAVWEKIFPSGGAGDAGICRHAIVTVGTSEILLDSCVDFGQRFVKCESVQVEREGDLVKIGSGGGGRVLAVISGEGHVQPGLDCGLRYKEGLMMRATLKFLKGVS